MQMGLQVRLASRSAGCSFGLQVCEISGTASMNVMWTLTGTVQNEVCIWATCTARYISDALAIINNPRKPNTSLAQWQQVDHGALSSITVVRTSPAADASAAP